MKDFLLAECLALLHFPLDVISEIAHLTILHDDDEIVLTKEALLVCHYIHVAQIF